MTWEAYGTMSCSRTDGSPLSPGSIPGATTKILLSNRGLSNSLIQHQVTFPTLAMWVPESMYYLTNSSGVYHPSVSDCQTAANKRLGHAVTVVGYGSDSSGTPYWLIKNSWGTSWGDSGYFKLYRGDQTCSKGSMWAASATSAAWTFRNVDDENSCKEYQYLGYCARNSLYYEYMQNYCRAACRISTGSGFSKNVLFWYKKRTWRYVETYLSNLAQKHFSHANNWKLWLNSPKMYNFGFFTLVQLTYRRYVRTHPQVRLNVPSFLSVIYVFSVQETKKHLFN